MDTQNAGPSYVLQDHLGGMTPLSNISPQSGMSFQLTPSHSMQGVWSPGPQDMWNMMVSMQQSLMQMTDKFVAQQKDMYEQRREIDMLKEANKELMQKLNTQQGQLDALEKRSTTHEESVKGMLTTPPSWAQVLAKGSQYKESDTRDDIVFKDAEEGHVFSQTPLEEHLDVEEREDRAKRKNNIVISGIMEEEGENVRNLKNKIQELFIEHFDMSDVPIEGAHRVGKKSEDGKRPKIIICTIMDTRKRQIILDNSSIYLRGTNVYINEDRTFMQQKAVREKVAARKAKIEKKKNKEEVENNHNNA